MHVLSETPHIKIVIPDELDELLGLNILGKGPIYKTKLQARDGIVYTTHEFNGNSELVTMYLVGKNDYSVPKGAGEDREA